MQVDGLIQVRQAITQLVASGMLSAPAGEQVQSILLQLLNECERRKQKAGAAIQALQQQISTTQGEVMAWSAMSSVVQSLLNANLERARAAAAEEAKRKAEADENASDREAAIRMQAAKDGLLQSQEEKVEEPKNGERKRRTRR